MESPPRGSRRRGEGPAVEQILCAIGLILQGIGVGLFVVWVGLFGSYPQTLLLALLACAPLSLFASAAVLWTAADGDDAPAALTFLLWAGVATEIFLIGLALSEVGKNLIDASTFGLDARLDAARLGSAAVGTLLLVGFLRVPLMRAGGRRPAPGHPRFPRIATLLGIAVATTLFLGAVAGATIDRHTLRCSPFTFDRERWDSAGKGSDRVRIATALARCGTLEGKTRSEVAQLLGIKPDQKTVVLDRTLGWTDSTSTLRINYGRDGRVRGVKVNNANANVD